MFETLTKATATVRAALTARERELVRLLLPALIEKARQPLPATPPLYFFTEANKPGELHFPAQDAMAERARMDVLRELLAPRSAEHFFETNATVRAAVLTLRDVERLGSRPCLRCFVACATRGSGPVPAEGKCPHH